MDNTAAPETSVKVETTVESVPVENRTPAVRYAVHLTSDKYQSHINKEQQLAASEMSLDEDNTYLQNLLQAKNDIPEVDELSLNAEWKLVQAIKQVFAPDEEHEVKLLAAFMADWLRVDAGDRNELVRSGEAESLHFKSESTSDSGATTGQVQNLIMESRLTRMMTKPHVIQSFVCPFASSYSPSSPPTNCVTT